MERPPGWGAALHPSCRHKYLALQEQLLASPSTAGTGAVGSPLPAAKGRQRRGSGSLTPSLDDPWEKAVGGKPLRPGDSRHLAAAGAEPSVSEHPSVVQEGAGARSWSCR